MRALKIFGIIAGVLVLIVAILSAMYISRRNEMVALKEVLVAGRRGDPAARGFDSEPGADGERLRDA